MTGDFLRLRNSSYFLSGGAVGSVWKVEQEKVCSAVYLAMVSKDRGGTGYTCNCLETLNPASSKPRSSGFLLHGVSALLSHYFFFLFHLFFSHLSFPLPSSLTSPLSYALPSLLPCPLLSPLAFFFLFFLSIYNVIWNTTSDYNCTTYSWHYFQNKAFPSFYERKWRSCGEGKQSWSIKHKGVKMSSLL